MKKGEAVVLACAMSPEQSLCAARDAYAKAVLQHADALSVVVSHVSDQTKPTDAETQRLADARAKLQAARSYFNLTKWREFPAPARSDIR